VILIFSRTWPVQKYLGLNLGCGGVVGLRGGGGGGPFRGGGGRGGGDHRWGGRGLRGSGVAVAGSASVAGRPRVRIRT
jgi:hypothetical protein